MKEVLCIISFKNISFFRQCLLGIKISCVSAVTDIPDLEENSSCLPSTPLHQISHPC